MRTFFSHCICVGAATYKYFLKIVPTTFKPLRGPIIRTYSYAVTEHVTHFGENQRGPYLPGVFFIYELNAIEINHRVESTPLTHFLVKVLFFLYRLLTLLHVLITLIQNPRLRSVLWSVVCSPSLDSWIDWLRVSLCR